MFLQHKQHPPFNKTTSLLTAVYANDGCFFGTPFENHKYAGGEEI
jgi:hypothetical protein